MYFNQFSSRREACKLLHYFIYCLAVMLIFVLGSCNKPGTDNPGQTSNPHLYTASELLARLSAGKTDTAYLNRLQAAYGPVQWHYVMAGVSNGHPVYLLPLTTSGTTKVTALLAIEQGVSLKYQVYDAGTVILSNPIKKQRSIDRTIAFFTAWLQGNSKSGDFIFRLPPSPKPKDENLRNETGAGNTARFTTIEACYEWTTCTGDGNGNCIGNMFYHTECVSNSFWVYENYWPGQTGGGGGNAGEGTGGGGAGSSGPPPGDPEDISGMTILPPPVNPITDVSHYLKCFDRTQPATITVYVNQPQAGSEEPFTITGKMGHVFIGIEQTVNGATVRRMIGFHPANKINPFNKTSSPATLGQDVNLAYDLSLPILANAAQFASALNNIEHFHSIYDLEDYNCTDFALDVAEAAGRSLPRTTGWWLVGRGRNPANLGQDLRAQQGVNTTKGRSQPNNYTCP